MNINKECVKVFDWDKAAELIANHKPLSALAGMRKDWYSTSELIYIDGEPVQNGICPVSKTDIPELMMRYDHDFEIVACYKIMQIKTIKYVDVVWTDSARRILSGMKPNSL